MIPSALQEKSDTSTLQLVPYFARAGHICEYVAVCQKWLYPVYLELQSEFAVCQSTATLHAKYDMHNTLCCSKFVYTANLLLNIFVDRVYVIKFGNQPKRGASKPACWYPILSFTHALFRQNKSGLYNNGYQVGKKPLVYLLPLVSFLNL